ncbi:MAG: type II toxin-antitoxin system PemK/MazF family toxin, partial [Chloroflexi bacterium]|nr:type II toxin-antitoxin system PemK/MazF family toxin [Chloroflexota bacterium]
MVASKPFVPRPGDVIELEFDPQVEHEQAGRRPALVLSQQRYNDKVGLAVLCPITNESKGYPWEVSIPVGQGVTGCVLSDQIKSLDWRDRNGTYVCHLPSD